MNVEIRTVAAQFLFWDCLFLIFGNGSLQCEFQSKECAFTNLWFYCIQVPKYRRPLKASILIILTSTTASVKFQNFVRTSSLVFLLFSGAVGVVHCVHCAERCSEGHQVQFLLFSSPSVLHSFATWFINSFTRGLIYKWALVCHLQYLNNLSIFHVSFQSNFLLLLAKSTVSCLCLPKYFYQGPSSLSL
jgi:hypothetical protein